MKIDKRKPLHWQWLCLFSAITFLSLLVRPFFRSKAEIVLYGHKLNGNLKAIYKESKKHEGLNPYYLSMDYDYCKELSECGVRVVWGGSWYAILLLARSRIIISDHGLHCLILLLKFTSIKFIDVWHGIPFKGFDKDDFKVQRQYHEVWVTSPHLAALYKEKFGFQQEKIKTLGYARTDMLVNSYQIDRTNLLQSYNIPGRAKKIVLYAPTWAQDKITRSLYPFGLTENEFLRGLSCLAEDQNCIFLIRMHLNSPSDVGDYNNIYAVPADRYPDTERLLLLSDVLIYDWSSIAFDFILLKRPAIYLDVAAPFKKGFSLDASYRYGMGVSDWVELKSTIKAALAALGQCEQENDRHREKIMSEVYGVYADGAAGERACQNLIRLCE